MHRKLGIDKGYTTGILQVELPVSTTVRPRGAAFFMPSLRAISRHTGIRRRPASRNGVRMNQYLVVANETLGGSHLVDLVGERLREGPCSFYIVVPATPPRGTWTYDENGARSIARGRLETALGRFRALGADVGGEVGDERPLDAIRDAMRAGAFDAVLLSTLPPGRSRWLKADLPRRVRAEFGVPVAHVIGVPSDEVSRVQGSSRMGRREVADTTRPGTPQPSLRRRRAG